MSRLSDPEVLVVGAGPVGLVAALPAAARSPRHHRRHAPADDPAQLCARDPSADAARARRSGPVRGADPLDGR